MYPAARVVRQHHLARLLAQPIWYASFVTGAWEHHSRYCSPRTGETVEASAAATTCSRCGHAAPDHKWRDDGGHGGLIECESCDCVFSIGTDAVAFHKVVTGDHLGS
jgi:hypothetical protein